MWPRAKMEKSNEPERTACVQYRRHGRILYVIGGNGVKEVDRKEANPRRKEWGKKRPRMVSIDLIKTDLIRFHPSCSSSVVNTFLSNGAKSHTFTPFQIEMNVTRH